VPDLTIETFWLCETARSWERTVEGSRGDRYRVCYGPTPSGPYQYGYFCECTGYRYRRTCSHIERAKPDHCNWNQFIDGGEPDAAGDCPRCGGPLTAERVAV